MRAVARAKASVVEDWREFAAEPSLYRRLHLVSTNKHDVEYDEALTDERLAAAVVGVLPSRRRRIPASCRASIEIGTCRL